MSTYLHAPTYVRGIKRITVLVMYGTVATYPHKCFTQECLPLKVRKENSSAFETKNNNNEATPLYGLVRQ